MLLEEYVTLFMMLSTVTLHSEHDENVWRWMANGKYSVKSAYECQFNGAMAYFPTLDMWKGRAEPKYNFFAWLALHNKTPAADNMEKKNWPCNLTCPLCYCQPETADHLLTECNCTEALWHIIANRFDLPTYNMLMSKGRLLEWVSHFTSGGTRQTKRKKMCVLFIFWWHIWKERNSRIFENQELFIPQLAAVLQEEIELFSRAHPV
jgi:hypothetical protein